MSNSTDQMLMLLPPNAKRRRTENAENKDRLSELPDCVLLHILSFLKAKRAVQTCMLSTRWKDLWKCLPTLVLHCHEFSNSRKFTNFVSMLLTLREGSTALHSLDVERYGPIEPHLLKRIVEYAVSHNVQQLGLSVTCGIEHFPPCMFSSQTLTSLKLSVYSMGSPFGKTLFPNSLNLPALTTLHLERFAFCGNDEDDRTEPFSSFNRLNSLIIVSCSLRDARILCISSSTLCNLSVFYQFVDSYEYSIELSSPSLRTFAFTGTPYLLLSGSNLSSIEQVNIDVAIWFLEEAYVDLKRQGNPRQPPLILLNWLLKLANIKSLTVSASTLQVLFLIPRLFELKLPYLDSLKSLKVLKKPLSHRFVMKLREVKLQKATTKLGEAAAAKLSREINEDMFSAIPDGIVNFLLRNSRSAKVDIINC